MKKKKGGQAGDEGDGGDPVSYYSPTIVIIGDLGTNDAQHIATLERVKAQNDAPRRGSCEIVPL